VKTFCYRKRKAQKAPARRSSQGTSGTVSRGSVRSSVGSEAREILMLLRCLATSTSAGSVGSMTQSSTLTSSATASQSSTSGPPSAPSPDTCP
jgi:hypothetical protein